MGNGASILPETSPSQRIHVYAEQLVDTSLEEYMTNYAAKSKPKPKPAPAPAVIAPYVPVVNEMPKMKFNLTLKVDDTPTIPAGHSSKLQGKPSLKQLHVPSGSSLHGSNKNSSTLNNLKSIKSLRSFALQHRSRHENGYIPQDTLVPRGLNKKTVEGRRSLTNVLNSSGHSQGSGSGKGVLATVSDSFSIDYDATIDRNVIDHMGMGNDGGNRKKPMLQISLDDGQNRVDVDEADWIQVSDDEDGPHEEVAHKRGKLTLNNGPEGSYIFTQSGTIFVDGFDAGGIRVDGIARDSIVGSRLNICDRVVVLCKLGSGASSVVYKALDLRDMRIVALKMVSVYERSKRRQMVRELSTLFQFLRQKRFIKPTGNKPITDSGISASTPARRSISEPDGFYLMKEPCEYVVDFFDAFSNMDEGGVALMIEYMDGGSLQDIVVAGGCDDEATLASIAVQALTGLSFLHSCSQLHRDLKPGNFLISNRGEVKVGDFGILRDMSDPTGGGVNGRSRTLSTTQEVPGEDASTPLFAASQELQTGDSSGQLDEAAILSGPPQSQNLTVGSPLQRAHTFVGTATYMSPERIDGREYSYPSDVWAFGLSLLTVSLGRLPIDTKGGYWSILQSIRDAVPPRVPNDGRFSAEYQDFIERCLQSRPESRWTCEQLLQHPFLEKARREDASTSEEDIQSGVSEFRAMLSALHVHLDGIRLEMHRGNAPGMHEKSPDESADYELFFGGLRKENTRVSDVIRSIVLGDFLELAPQVSAHEPPEFPPRGIARLVALSNQLNVSPDRLMAELEDACNAMDSSSAATENLIGTPKANRRR